jgi:uncharacterized membrane protein (DUF4010 family)
MERGDAILPEAFIGLSLALALGLLIGVERGWQARTAAEGSRIAGIRTFGLIGLLGGLWEILARGRWEIIFGLAFLAFAIVMVVAYVVEARATHTYGVTTTVAALITFVLGALAARGQHEVAATGAVVMTILLSAKPVLHRWVEQIEAAELTAALKLLLISVVVLPVLPDRGFGPWQALNPYQIWWLVVLLAGISFAAYCAMKIVGAERGILLTGFLGGLVSSTAVTLQLSRLARRAQWPHIFTAGILVAGATMFIRMLLVVAIVSPILLRPLVVPLVAMAVTAFAAATGFALNKRAITPLGRLELSNPVELTPALQFAALLAIILFLTKWVGTVFGESGLYPLTAISSLADVDAITISLARLASHGDIPVAGACRAIVLAGAVNTGAKAVLAIFIGGPILGLRVAWPLVLALLIGGALLWRGAFLP